MNGEDVEERMVEGLFEVSSNHSNEGIAVLEEKGMEITRDKSQINDLERDLRFSNLIILFMLLSNEAPAGASEEASLLVIVGGVDSLAVLHIVESEERRCHYWY